MKLDFARVTRGNTVGRYIGGFIGIYSVLVGLVNRFDQAGNGLGKVVGFAALFLNLAKASIAGLIDIMRDLRETVAVTRDDAGNTMLAA